jgi:hypothetical protein
MVVKLLDNRCVTLTLKFARLLAIPTLSVLSREEVTLSLEELIVKPMELAALVTPPTTVEFWMEETLLDKLLAIPLLVFASRLSLALTTLIATLLEILVLARIVRPTNNVLAALLVILLLLVELLMEERSLDKSIATSFLVSVWLLATTTTIALVLKELTAWTTEFALIVEMILIAMSTTLGSEITMVTEFALTPFASLVARTTVFATTTKIA